MIISGTSGNDTLVGTSGDDSIDGISGKDTAIIKSKQAQTTFGLDSSGRWIIHSAGGTDTLANIDTLLLNDSVIGIKQGAVAINHDLPGDFWAVSSAQPMITGLENGGYMVGYNESISTYSDSEKIWLQLLDSAGNKIGSGFAVNSSEANDIQEIKYSSLPNGDYIVGWIEDNSNSSSVSINGYLQRFDANNQPVGDKISLAFDLPAYRLQLATLANGSFIASWLIWDDINSKSGIYTQYFNADGATTGIPQQIYADITDEVAAPNITALNDGEYIVTWTSFSFPSNHSSIYLQRFDNAGNSLGEPALLLSETSTAEYLDVNFISTVLLPNGHLLLTWSTSDNSWSMSLHTQQYDITGNKIGSETLVNSIPHKMYFSTWFKTVVLDNGDYVVAWSSDPTRLSEYSDSYMQIYFQRFNENGNKLGDEQQVDTANNFSFNSGREFNLAALANGGFVIGWNSSPNFENIVLARRFDANGNPELPALTGDATDNRLVFDGTQSVALLGMNGNDSLRGGSGNDSLAGGNDNDTLMGGTGNDTLAGGTGSDLYFVDSSLDVVRDSGTLSTDIDTVKSSASFTLTNNIELLILAGTAAINGTGNTLDNTITGNTANNLLNGAAGNDLLVGGYGKDTLSGGTGIDTLQGDAGSDTYILDNINDVIIETSTAMTDIDTVNAGFNYTLASTLENLTLTGSLAINATGNALNNTLTGNIKANTLYGLDGNDKLAGGAGNDTLIGGDGADKFILDSLSGIDTISDFVSNIDDVVFSASTLKVGDGDALLEGKLLRNASGGFGTSNELVIFTANITGNISNSNAAATIGSATAAMVIGEKKLFVVDNGTESNIYLFTSADGNAVVNGNELKLLATITGVNDSSTSDYLLQA